MKQALAFAAWAGIAAAFSKPREKNILPGAFIYEFEDGVVRPLPLFLHNDTLTLTATQTVDMFRASLGSNAEVRKSFDSDLFRGASVQFKNGTDFTATAQDLAESSKIKQHWPVYLYAMPESYGRKPQGVVAPRTESEGSVYAESLGMSIEQDKNKEMTADAPLTMMQVKKLHEKGFDGKGIKIAVIDTGVDYTHPALGGCFGKGCRVSFGYDLVGDRYTGWNNPVPRDDPMACDGHGTHVTGIISAAKNAAGFMGVAPGVTMGHYKVFGCWGSTSTEVLMEAAIMAAEQKPHAISVSIGSFGGYADAWAVLVNRLAHRGIVPVVANGNAGFFGGFATNPMAIGENIVSVAAVDNKVKPTILHAGKVAIDGNATKPFHYAAGYPKAWREKPMPVWPSSLDKVVDDDACNELPANTPDLANHVVLTRLGGCHPYFMATNLAAKNATHVLFYAKDDVPEGAWAGAEGIQAIGALREKDGLAWLKQLQAGRKLVASVPNPNSSPFIVEYPTNSKSGGSASEFTSWGPTMEMNFAPVVAAPGGNILSSTPLKDGGYDVWSGTSMATPMIAGVVALMQQVNRGKLNVTSIRNRLSSTAEPLRFNNGTTWSSGLAPVAQQGGGIAQAWDAAFTSTEVEPSLLSFNDTGFMPSNVTLKIRNHGSYYTTYTLEHISASSAYLLDKSGTNIQLFPPEQYNSSVKLEFSEPKITIEGGESALVSVMLKNPAKDDLKRVPYHSGYISITGDDGSRLSVAYQHVGTSFQSLPAMAPGAFRIFNSTDYEIVKEGAHFELPKPGTMRWGDEMPIVEPNLIIGSRYVDKTVWSVTANGTQNIGSLPYYPIRNSHRYPWSTYWDGQMADGSYVPAGEYVFGLRALRLYGDAKNPKHWDSDVTPRIRISYKQ